MEIFLIVIIVLIIAYLLFMCVIPEQEATRPDKNSNSYKQGSFDERISKAAKIPDEKRVTMKQIEENPDWLELFEKYAMNITHDEPITTFAEIPEQIKYKEKMGLNVNRNHIGQRKLLLSEIDFLNRVQNKDKPFRVIYVGSSPGMHIGLLLEQYPQMRIITVDPSQLTIYIPTGWTPNSGTVRGGDVDPRYTQHSYPDLALYFSATDTSMYPLESGDIGRNINFYNAEDDTDNFVDLDIPSEWTKFKENNSDMQKVGDKIIAKIKRDEYRVYNFGQLFDYELSKVLTAENLDDMPLYFWSDIRTRDIDKSAGDQGVKEFESAVLVNLAMQIEWVLRCKANEAMIKMRLPFIKDIDLSMQDKKSDMRDVCTRLRDEYGYDLCGDMNNFTLPAGDIRLQTRVGGKSTEARLIIKRETIEAGDKMKINFEEYENKFVFLNYVVRPCYFHKNEYAGKMYLCHCWDCTIEGKILKEAGLRPVSYAAKMDYLLKQHLSQRPDHVCIFEPLKSKEDYLDKYGIKKI